MIIASAIKIFKSDYESFIIMGKRHEDCFNNLCFTDNPRAYFANHIQGFMTHDYKFLDRYEAKAHAIECGQIESSQYAELYSEDLW